MKDIYPNNFQNAYFHRRIDNYHVGWREGENSIQFSSNVLKKISIVGMCSPISQYILKIFSEKSSFNGIHRYKRSSDNVDVIDVYKFVLPVM